MYRSLRFRVGSVAIIDGTGTNADGVFGGGLFRGKFAQQSFRGFNPDHVISVGDRIDLKLWGAYDLVLRLEVDSQGNIFVPKVGPIHVSNTRNGNLNAVVTEEVKKVFRDNVGVYASRNAAFQALLKDLTGRNLALDGDLLRYQGNEAAKEPGATELAALSVAPVPRSQLSRCAPTSTTSC